MSCCDEESVKLRLVFHLDQGRTHIIPKNKQRAFAVSPTPHLWIRSGLMKLGSPLHDWTIHINTFSNGLRFGAAKLAKPSHKQKPSRLTSSASSPQFHQTLREDPPGLLCFHQLMGLTRPASQGSNRRPQGLRYLEMLEQTEILRSGRYDIAVYWCPLMSIQPSPCICFAWIIGWWIDLMLVCLSTVTFLEYYWVQRHWRLRQPRLSILFLPKAVPRLKWAKPRTY